MTENNIFVKISIWLIINLHQQRFSKHLQKKGVRCRFHPSCSNYGIQALEKYGFWKGWWKAFNRIRRCVPDNYGTCVDYP